LPFSSASPGSLAVTGSEARGARSVSRPAVSGARTAARSLVREREGFESSASASGSAPARAREAVSPVDARSRRVRRVGFASGTSVSQ
jgi:hypothetical protein